MTTLQSPTPEQALEVAAKYIREYGWVKGEMGGNRGPACLMGAIREATNTLIPEPRRSGWKAAWTREGRRLILRDHARNLLMERIKACFPRSSGARESSVPQFNDASTRKIEDVLKVLDGTCES